MMKRLGFPDSISNYTPTLVEVCARLVNCIYIIFDNVLLYDLWFFLTAFGSLGAIIGMIVFGKNIEIWFKIGASRSPTWLRWLNRISIICFRPTSSNQQSYKLINCILIGKFLCQIFECKHYYIGSLLVLIFATIIATAIIDYADIKKDFDHGAKHVIFDSYCP